MHLEPGTWADAEALVGTVIAESVGADPVNAPMVRHYLESLEWDSRAWNRPVREERQAAPFATYMTFGMPAYWSPGDPHLPDQSLAPFPFGRVPAPGSAMLATRTDVEFHERMHAGDRLVVVWKLVGVTRKRLALGDGAFLDFEATYRTQDGTLVAVERTSAFRYEPEEARG
jgi:hypothetical protein